MAGCSTLANFYLMTLKELVDGVALELKSAGLEEAGASLSLAFSAKREMNGTVSCDFVDASALSKPERDELHRIELKLLPRPEKTAPARSLKAKANTEPVRIRLRDEISDMDWVDLDDPDTPAILRLNRTGSDLSLRL